MSEEKFLKLLNLDVNDKTETRSDGNTELTYLSWSYAWVEFKKVYPEAQYTIAKFEDTSGNLVPYMYDKNTGYMVATSVTADGLSYEMWLPVMDSKNKAMKSEPYEYTTKRGKRTVEAATMFDVNKTIMRCLVKNLAMFGLGMYIYAGEDLPEKISETEETKEQKAAELTQQINGCKSEEELAAIYRGFKAQICSNPELLDLITKKGTSFRKTA